MEGEGAASPIFKKEHMLKSGHRPTAGGFPEAANLDDEEDVLENLKDDVLEEQA